MTVFDTDLDLSSDPPRVSVIINAFNGEDFIHEALACVIAQTYENWEIILWDDRSTDSTAEIVRSCRDDRLRYFRAPEWTPLGRARHLAIEQARGEWLAFLDQDDVWSPDKLAQQIAVIDEEQAPTLGLIYTRARRSGASGAGRYFHRRHESGPLPEGSILSDLLLEGCFVAISSVLVRSSAYEAVGGIPSEYAVSGDYYLFVAVAEQYTARAVGDVCCWYRVHDGSMSHSSAVRVQAHKEALRIIDRWGGAIGPERAAKRRRVHHTLIAVEEVLLRREIGQGLARLVRDGSIAYLLSRPIAWGWRSLQSIAVRRTGRAWVPGPPGPSGVPLEGRWRADGRGSRGTRMRKRVVGLVRRLGLLPLAERVRYYIHRVLSFWENRRFARAHPDFEIPPRPILFDIANTLSLTDFHRVGQKHARLFAQIITNHVTAERIRVLEWGCGPGRLIRYMPALLNGREFQLTATDVNPESIAWCKQHLPGSAYEVNGVEPPLPFSDGQFDVIYNYSVLTHLSEALQRRWVKELHRLLCPGGVLVCTTHGDHYRSQLYGNALDTYRRGELVVLDGFPEGQKHYLTYHPPSYVREQLLRDFEVVAQLPSPEEYEMYQDVWVARRPE